jgi:hypothetical protein
MVDDEIVRDAAVDTFVSVALVDSDVGSVTHSALTIRACRALEFVRRFRDSPRDNLRSDPAVAVISPQATFNQFRGKRSRVSLARQTRKRGLWKSSAIESIPSTVRKRAYVHGCGAFPCCDRSWMIKKRFVEE